MLDKSLCIVRPQNNTNAMALKIQRGFYMGGIISPDQRACKCGGKFVKKEFRGANYFSCDKCDKDPAFFRVRRYLPGPFGEKGKTVEIRYDSNGKRLTSIQAAHATMEYIDGLVSNNKFDPAEFMIKEANNMLIFENFINKKYIPHYETRLKTGEYKPSSMQAKKQYLRNFLLPMLKGKNIREIKGGFIKEFNDKIEASPRMRDLVLQELKTILNYARSIDMVEFVPPFPQAKRAKLKDPEKFLTKDQQLEVLDHVDNEKYKTMLSILCYFPLRPSEIRALKWCDLDFKTGFLLIRRHVTIRSVVIDGRKSTEDLHSLPITPEFLKLIEHLPRPIQQDEYIFKGEVGEITSEHCLSRAWKKAMALTKLPYVDMYRGTKSSRMSQMLRAGASITDIAALAGISEGVADRYAQYDQASSRENKEKLLNFKTGNLN